MSRQRPRPENDLFHMITSLQDKVKKLERSPLHGPFTYLDAATKITGDDYDSDVHRVQVKCGTTTGTTDGSGRLTVPFAGGAFPNGLGSVVAWNGDSSSVGLTYGRISATLTSFLMNATQHTLTGNVVYINQLIRVDYIAVGW